MELFNYKKDEKIDPKLVNKSNDSKLKLNDELKKLYIFSVSKEANNKLGKILNEDFDVDKKDNKINKLTNEYLKKK